MRGDTIGGTTPAARNLISGNVDRGSSIPSAYGIAFQGAASNNIDSLVEGNLIGTDVTGTHALGNDSGGIAGGVSEPNVGSVIVGGTAAGAGNLISGNGGIGVASRNGVVEGNFIGTDVTGTSPIGNSVGVSATGNVLIAQNTIAFNTTAGVDLPGISNQFGATVPTTGNLITQNAIFSNFGPGIGSSSYLNDSPDADGIQNYPTLSSVMPNGVETQVEGTLASTPSSDYRLEFFASAERVEDAHDVSNVTMPGEFAQGRTYLGTIDVTTDATGQASFTADLPGLPAGQPYVTATATDITDDGSGPRNNTSPFSAVAVLGGPSFVVTNTNDSGLGSLREAIFNANLTPGAQTITFAIPATDPRHFYYRDDGVAGHVSQADVAVTTATDDSTIAGIDPDWPYSWYSIAPDQDLPEIFDTIVIDGNSQPGSRQNTLPALGDLDTVLRVELDGTNAPGAGLELGSFDGSFDSSNSQIDGLVINRFGGDGIAIDTLNGGNTVAGNFLGTDVSGTIALGNTGSGVRVNIDDDDTIGGTTPGSRNLISGNQFAGITTISSAGTLIQGDDVGGSRSGTNILGNNGTAVRLDTDLSNPTSLTGDSTSDGVAHAFLQADTDSKPIKLTDDQFDDIQYAGMNRIFIGFVQTATALLKNGKTLHLYVAADKIYYYIEPPRSSDLATSDIESQSIAIDPANATAIDIGEDGVTPNDLGDLDGIQNYPVLASAATVNGQTTIRGSLNSLANATFQVELYSSQALIPSGHGPGEQPLGTIDVTTDSQGNAAFTFLSPIAVPVGQFITSLATRLEAGSLAPIDTSEFSAGIVVTATVAQPTANLSVSQSAAPNPVSAGSNVTFTLTVANAGPDAATNVRLVVTPPSGAAFISATGGVAPAGGTLTFVIGTLASGGSATIDVIVQAAAPGTLVSMATVTSDATDPATADNTGTASVTVAPVTTVNPPPPADTVGPTVSSVAQGPDTKTKQTAVVLTFSEALDRTRAANLANYRLVTPGRDKKFGTRDDKVVALLSATYDPTARTVTLVLGKKLTAAGLYQLTVDGTSASGITDVAGNLLDGNHDGGVSGNLVATFRLKPPKARRRS